MKGKLFKLYVKFKPVMFIEHFPPGYIIEV